MSHKNRGTGPFDMLRACWNFLQLALWLNLILNLALWNLNKVANKSREGRPLAWSELEINLLHVSLHRSSRNIASTSGPWWLLKLTVHHDEGLLLIEGSSCVFWSTHFSLPCEPNCVKSGVHCKVIVSVIDKAKHVLTQFSFDALKKNCRTNIPKIHSNLPAVTVELPLNLLNQVAACADFDKFVKTSIHWLFALGKAEANKISQAQVG